MRQTALALVLLLMALCRADFARAEYAVVLDPANNWRGLLVWTEPGKNPEVMEEADVFSIRDSDWNAVVLTERKDSPRPATLIFDKEGKLLYEIHSIASRDTGYMVLSPGKDILAVDSGFDAYRTWSFIKLPEGTLINGPIIYVRGSQHDDMELVWLDNDTALYSALRNANFNDPPSCATVGGAYLCKYNVAAADYEFVEETSPICRLYHEKLEAMDRSRDDEGE